ncbi:MAG TPA: cation diffusion facilitator family transporter [Candidatus Dormibacteraeota bacterium]|nr:cation diffusion facilitator family transporter [Candidatus Dormibacteraeota bacterium]
MHAHDHGGGDRVQDRRALRWALALTAAFCVVEFVGGWLSNSLALLSDAVHMLTDVGALALGLFALWVAGRPATDSKTFGYHRAEILAALANGVVLGLAVLFILSEAWERLHDPHPVKTGGMMIVAAIGLVVNVVCARLLVPGEAGSLNRRAAFLHVISDLFGSLGALIAGAVILVTGWPGADAVAAALISLLILFSAWQLVRESLDVLMEAVPSHIDLEQLRDAMAAVPGACRVHDLHVWTLTTGRYALAAHVVVDADADGEAVLETLRSLLADRFAVHHVTIQLECTRPCEPESVHA